MSAEQKVMILKLIIKISGNVLFVNMFILILKKKIFQDVQDAKASIKRGCMAYDYTNRYCSR